MNPFSPDLMADWKKGNSVQVHRFPPFRNHQHRIPNEYEGFRHEKTHTAGDVGLCFCSP